MARDWRRRRRNLGWCASSANSIFGNSQASALDPDRGHARARARPPRRSRRRAVAFKRNAELCVEGIRRYRGPAFLRALRCRPVRHRTSIRCQCAAPCRRSRRLHDQPTARQKSFSDSRTHDHPQIAGSAPGPLAGAQIFQDADSRNVPQPGIFRRWRLWHRAGLAALFRKIGATHHAGGSCAAGRTGKISVATCTYTQFRRR